VYNVICNRNCSKFINPVKIALNRAVLTFNMRRNIVTYPSQQEKEVLHTQLNLLGAKEVIVEFRGGGDDGQVEGVYYRDKHDEMQDIPTNMIAWTKVAYGHQTAEQKETTLVDVLEDLCYRALDGTGLDWYNNEGGQGQLVIDFRESPPRTTLHVGVNTMTTDDHDFDLDEEIE
jgi:hypothetical protein